MKILVFNSSAFFHDSSGYYIYKSTGEFLSNLSRRGYEIEMVHFLVEKTGNDFLANYELSVNNIDVYGLKRFRFKFVSYLNGYIRSAIRILKSDYVYIFYPNNFYLLCFICWFFNIPFGLYLRGQKSIKSSISRFIFKKASIVNTVSPEFTAFVRKVGGNSVTIKPMIDFSLSDLRENLIQNITSKFRLLFVGRIEKDKGIFELLSALKILKCSGYQFQMNFVGDGPDLIDAKNFADSSGLSKFVTFHGSIFDKRSLKSFYCNSHLLVLPTYHEGFPRVIYESMIFGIPIVTTFVGAIPFLMKDGFNCFEISPRNIDSILIVLTRIFDNYVCVDPLVRNARDTIVEYLTINSLSHEDILINDFEKYLDV